MLDRKEILERYLPENSIDLVMQLIADYRFQLRITKQRSTKVGDYRSPSGGKAHRISVNHDLNPYSFLVTLIHEVAHLLTFERYKRSASPHGPEWKQEYRLLLQPFFERMVFPQDLEKALNDFFNNHGDNNRTDLILNTILRKYDLPNGKVTVGTLPVQSLFKLHDGRLFIKGELVRSRYRCKCLNNHRTYLVSHMMEVHPVHYQYSINFTE